MGLLIDSEELIGAMAAGLKQDLQSAAYRVVLDDDGELEWQGKVDGEHTTENTEPLADSWPQLKA